MRYRMGTKASKLVMVGLVLVAGLVLRVAYEQLVYPSKPAQAALVSDPSDPNNLDSDGNGRACDDYPYGTSGSVAASAATTSSASPGKPLRTGASSKASAPPRPQKTHNLFDSGGPTDGPVPLMADGGCPVEFPVEHSGLCHE
jgi:hypothetical protein